MSEFSVRHIDYLEGRVLAPDQSVTTAPQTAPTASGRRILRITRVGEPPGQPIATKDTPPPPSVGVLVGLSAYKIPLAFRINCDARGIALNLGVWSPDRQAAANDGLLDAWQDVLQTLLAGTYPTIEAEPAPAALASQSSGTLVLGIPSFVMASAPGAALPLDRLIRAMAAVPDATQNAWSALVLAEPVDDAVIDAVRGELLSEFLETRAGSQSARLSNPMAEYYMKLLDISTARAVRGLAEGAWRVAVYLSGDRSALARLASAWKSIFQGQFSVPQPIALHALPDVPGLADRWAMPDVAAPKGPGLYSHPFSWQSLLTSSELAAYVHLPGRETKGIAVRPVTLFNVVANMPEAETSIAIGEICELRRPVGLGYRTELKDLRRHGLIVGMTGSGKTNTVKGLLSQFGARDIPFLVIEPAKKEYRELLQTRQFAEQLTVWTIGNETCAPLRLNPFEFEAGTPVSSHIDLLKSLFTASFGLWTPLPQILERCLHEIYEDCGWIIATGENRRFEDVPDASAFPTLSDLVAKVGTVTEALGYHGEFTSNARAALQTRLNSLRSGGKGRMFDVRRGIPVSVLLDRPTIVELEDIGDDDDKAFFIGLMLLRLAEYRRIHGAVEGLRHVVVFEEAHRLFARTGPKLSEEQASPRAKAVETFANLLAEMRAYGQGVLIADQTPTKLAPDVIKNTALKICHRLVDGEERTTMAAAMAMNQHQATALGTLRRNHGEAIVFGEGDEASLFVSVPLFAPEASEREHLEADIAARWQDMSHSGELASCFLPFPTCALHCQPINDYCSDERPVAGSPAVQATFESLVLSLAVASDVASASAVTEQLTDVIARQLSARPVGGVEPKVRLRCVLNHAAFGFFRARAQALGWDQATANDLVESLVAALAGVLQRPSGESGASLLDFGQRFAAACPGPGPFRQCSGICGETCLFRLPNRDRPVPRGLGDAFDAAIATLPTDPIDAARQLESVLASAADTLLSAGAGDMAAWQAGACFILHRIDALEGYRWDEKAALADTCLKILPAPDEEETT